MSFHHPAQAFHTELSRVLYQGQTEPFKVGREFAAQVVCQVSPVVVFVCFLYLVPLAI